MTNFDAVLTARAPFEGLIVRAAPGSGVTIFNRDGLGMATLSVRKGATGALVQVLSEQFEIDLKLGPYRSSAGEVALHGIGPGTWLATCERGGHAFASRLTDLAGRAVFICDQSDGYAVLRLSGPRARDTLSTLVPVDMHPRVFKVDDVAVTVAAHMGVTLWRREDDPQGLPVFELAVFRSLAHSFWEALCASAAEFGIDA